MQLTQGLRRSAELFPRRPALIFGARETSWAEMQRRVARLAAAFRARGVRAGSRIGILALNSDRYAECYFAIAWAGCVAVPFNTRWASAEIEFAFDDSAPEIMLLDPAFAAWEPRFAEWGAAVFALEPDMGFLSLDNLIRDHDTMPDQDRSGDDLAGIFYTGGTTGRAKGVMLSHANLVTNFLTFHAVAPYPQEARFLHTAPMFHMADACVLFGLTLLGATHVMLPGFDAGATARAIEEHRITAMMLVPTMIAMLCEEVRRTPADTSSVLRLSYGASPIASTVLKTAMACLPNARFVQAYGQTELSPVVTALDHDDHLAGRLRSAGRVVPTMQIRIVGQDGTPAAAGMVGEIEAKGPSVMLGYWNQPDLTAQAVVDGWLKTGDAGRLDGDGYLFLEDRVKDMIVSGGENVYSAEVENALMSHPAVVQCAVIGVPDARWGERVHAIVQLREGMAATQADLATHCEPLIANYKRPKSFDLRTTPLPLSGVGKIMKAELRKPFWEGQSRQIG